MSPLAKAARIVVSGTFRLRFKRSSNGLFPSSDTRCSVSFSSMAFTAVEGSIDHIHLLLACQPHEVDGIT